MSGLTRWYLFIEEGKKVIKLEKEINIEESMKLNTKLLEIQNKLKAPKNQRNNFGGYNYRSCEDILEAVKPLLKKYNCTLQLEDYLENIGERYYIRAIAKLIDAEKPYVEDDEICAVNCITNSAYAREEENKKGMDGSQITGASSSYARKYALNGLFLIDDVKDSDTTNIGSNEEIKATAKQLGLIKELVEDIDAMLKYYDIKDITELTMTQASEIISKKLKKENK